MALFTHILDMGDLRKVAFLWVLTVNLLLMTRSQPLEVDGLSKSSSDVHPSAMRQWASRVLGFSSEYDNAGWSAAMVLGQPKVYPRYGDIQGAWASSVRDQNQFIELEFETPVKPTAINIYETYFPGAVVCVKARGPSPNNQWTVLWRTPSATQLGESRIFSPPLPDLVSDLTINQLRLEIDCSVGQDWCEIDAVELVGIRQDAKPVDDSQYFEDMKLLVNNRLFSDVELQIDHDIVYAHKAILSTRSSFFARIFKKGRENNVNLELPNVSKQDFIAAVTFLYINRLPPDCSIETLLNLCKTAETFEIKDMKIAVLNEFTKVISFENVVSILLSLENDPSAGEFKSLCIRFMAKNLKAMTLAPGFGKLPQKYLVEIVQDAMAYICTYN